MLRVRSQAYYLTGILLFGPFFLAWLPNGGEFLLDGAWALLVLLAGKARFYRGARGVEGLLLWALLGLIFFGGVYLARFQSALYFLWGVRNNFRFYGAFFGFTLLSDEERQRLWRGLEGIFWGNFWFALGQFFLGGFRGDHLGGLFGTEKGCNGSVNLFLLVMVTRSLVLAGEGQESGGRCLEKCAAALLVAALAELKFFFVEFFLLLLVPRGKPGVKIGAAVALAGSVLVLYRCFPEFAGWLRPQTVWETASAEAGYASVGDLNRLNAVSGINRRVFSSPWERVFGLGLGNCQESAVSFLNTPFYRWYGKLHYTWMSHAFWYVEGGWLGLVFFFGFFVLILWKRAEGAEGKVARVLAFFCLLVGVYNASLRTEAAFLVYFGLSGCVRPGRGFLDTAEKLGHREETIM